MGQVLRTRRAGVVLASVVAGGAVALAAVTLGWAPAWPGAVGVLGVLFLFGRRANGYLRAQVAERARAEHAARQQAELLNRAQQKLTFQNALLAAQTEATIDGILAIGTDGTVLLVNRRFRQMWDISDETVARGRAAMLERAAGQLCDPGRFLAEIEHLHRHPEVAERGEIRMRDGRVLDRYTTPLLGEDGTCFGRVTYYRDVTDLHRATGELVEWRNRYEAAMRATGEVLFDWDTETDQITWGGSCREVLGYAAEELGRLGLAGAIELIHPDDRDAARAQVEQARRSKAPSKLAFRMRRKDGSTIHVEDNARFFRGADGRAVRMIGFVRDVTERQRAQRLLAESEERFRTLVANLPGAVYKCAYDAQWTMHYLSDAIEPLTGYPAGDFLGNARRTFAEVVEPEDYAGIVATIVDAIARREPFQLEYRFRHADGGTRWVFEKGRAVYGAAGDVEYLEGAIFDVTELRRAHDRLRESQECLAAVVECSEDAIFTEDLDGRVRSWNAAAERIFGYGAAEMVGRLALPLLPEDRRHEQDEILARLRRGDRVEHFETARVRKDGRRIEVAITTSPIRDREGRIVGASKIARDVTRRKEAEAALARQEELLRHVLQALPVGVCITDAAGRITTINPAMAAVWGGARHIGVDEYGQYKAWRRGDGRPLAPRDWPVARALRDRAPCVGQSVHIETFDGRRRTIDVSAAPILDPAGALMGSVGVVVDVTEQEKAGRDLAASEQFARAIVDALTAELAILDERGVIVAVNAAWQQFGRENGLQLAADGIGANYLAVCDAAEAAARGRGDHADAEAARDAGEGIRAVLAGELPGCYLEYGCHSRDVERWFAMRVTRFDAGTGTRVLVAHEDVTGRRVAERLERERAGLREAVRAMEQVLGVVGHELRTPLAALRAISEYLITDGARSTSEWDRFLHDMGDEVDRMAETVNNLLEAARLNSGRARWNWGEVSLAEQCAEAIESVGPLVDASRVTLSLDVDPGAAGRPMRGDGEALRRLVTNLLSNARKHTAAGHIRVTVRSGDCGDCGGAGLDGLDGRDRADGTCWAEVAVSDTGSGIPPEVLARLGEAFALNSGVVGCNHIGGTGLGLAICKGIVAAHGGELRVESAVGAGTTITACLRTDLPAAAEGDTVHTELVKERCAS